MTSPADGFDGHVEDFELTLGAVTGVRGFLQDSLGRLTGVSYRKVFKPDLNTASCATCDLESLSDCACGFYGYFDPEETSRLDFYGGKIGAIVRGYGRTVVGTKGFRAEKADLVAFFPIDTVEEKKKTEKATTTKTKPKSPFRALYPDADWFVKRGENTLLGGVALAFALLLGSLSVVVPPTMFFDGEPDLALLFLTTLPVALWFAGFSHRMWWGGLAKIDLKYPSLPAPNIAKLNRLSRNPVSLGTVKDTAKPDPFTRLRVLYPDTPVYETFQEAAKAHPLTDAQEFQPPEPSPDDPDFWDLEVDTKRDDSWGNLLHNSVIPNFQANRGPITFATGGYTTPAPKNPYDLLDIKDASGNPIRDKFLAADEDLDDE